MRQKTIRPSALYDLYQNGEYTTTGTIVELAKLTGYSAQPMRSRIDNEVKGMLLKEAGVEKQAYALYDDDILIADGTLEQISKQMYMSVQNLYWYLSPQARERNISKQLVILEGETVRVRHNTFDRKAYKRAEIDERERKKKIKYVKARKAEFKPSEHVRYLHDLYFKKWGVEI